MVFLKNLLPHSKRHLKVLKIGLTRMAIINYPGHYAHIETLRSLSSLPVIENYFFYFDYFFCWRGIEGELLCGIMFYHLNGLFVLFGRENESGTCLSCERWLRINGRFWHKIGISILFPSLLLIWSLICSVKTLTLLTLSKLSALHLSLSHFVNGDYPS